MAPWESRPHDQLLQHDEYPQQSQRTGVWKQYIEAAHRGPTCNCNL